MDGMAVALAGGWEHLVAAVPAGPLPDVVPDLNSGRVEMPAAVASPVGDGLLKVTRSVADAVPDINAGRVLGFGLPGA